MTICWLVFSQQPLLLSRRSTQHIPDREQEQFLYMLLPIHCQQTGMMRLCCSAATQCGKSSLCMRPRLHFLHKDYVLCTESHVPHDAMQDIRSQKGATDSECSCYKYEWNCNYSGILPIHNMIFFYIYCSIQKSCLKNFITIMTSTLTDVFFN